eukprot:5997930-Prorocentrum_lima.AAC.1
MANEQLHRALLIALARYHPQEKLMLDQQFTWIQDYPDLPKIDIAGAQDHERQGMIERTMRAIRDLIKKNESRTAESGSYADRTAWAAEVCRTLNTKPLMSSPFGEITSIGLQSGSYSQE